MCCALVRVGVCVREREAPSCRRRSSARVSNERDSAQTPREDRSASGRGFTSAQVPLRPRPSRSLKSQTLCFLLFSPSLPPISHFLFPITSFSYLCSGSRGSTLRLLVTGGHKFVSRSQERGGSCACVRACVYMCVCIEGGDQFGLKVGCLCTRPDARASSINRRDISTTKRLQSNGAINLISARICQSKERQRRKEEL